MQAPNNNHDASYFKDSSHVHNCQLQLLIIIEAGVKFNLMEVFGKPAEAGTVLEGFDQLWSVIKGLVYQAGDGVIGKIFLRVGF
jgi:hypothetical protein